MSTTKRQKMTQRRKARQKACPTAAKPSRAELNQPCILHHDGPMSPEHEAHTARYVPYLRLLLGAVGSDADFERLVAEYPTPDADLRAVGQYAVASALALKQDPDLAAARAKGLGGLMTVETTRRVRALRSELSEELGDETKAEAAQIAFSTALQVMGAARVQ